MKILIVDDNVAVQEIIRDIVEVDGHIARMASTIEEGLEKIASFEPDIVFLDSHVGDEEGMHLVTRLRDENPDADLNIIIIKSALDHVPTDDPWIKKDVSKPFKSEEILGALYSVVQTGDIYSRKAKEKKKKPRRKLFGRRDRLKKASVDASEKGIIHGRSYVIFETYPEAIYEFVNAFNDDYDVMIITSSRLKAVNEKFDYRIGTIRSMTSNPKPGMYDIHSLGSLIVSIDEYKASSRKPVVVFDNFDEIAKVNGLNATLTMVHELFKRDGKECTFAFSVDDSEMSEKDRRILLHYMKEYTRKE
ncbi:MAG: response regulator [Candidatus Methanomethylophilaceae archaeon]|nr:response regulator [Candidatus Methanomethylophilaceae archaeon]